MVQTKISELPEFTGETNENDVIILNSDGTTKKMSFGALFYSLWDRNPRWLRFDPDNKRGLIIKGGTTVKLECGIYKHWLTDTKIDLTDTITEPGTDYFVFIDNAGNITASTETYIYDNRKIGRFHTLCVDAGNMTMLNMAPPSSGITTDDTFLVKPYDQDRDPDFYDFYNKSVTAVTVQSAYDVITTEHPLNDFVACDILPESVFCIDFCPDCKFEDAMVYDRSTNIAVDIYLMSGTITNSRSKYNETHTVSRTPSNLWRDLCSVGKRPIKNIEFFDIAVGSNVKTSINGSKDWTTVGGHLDTANRRMIAANGCEEMCGYLMTVLTPISTLFNTTGYTTDTHASFGTSYGMINTVAAGGYWGYNNSYSGLTSRYTSIYEYTATNYIGTRGCKEMRINQERRY